MSAPRLLILASGTGTNLQAVIDATRAEDPATRLHAAVVGVYSHAASALSLRRAERYGIPGHFIAPPRRGVSRDDWERDFAARLHATHDPIDLVLLLGWMRVFGPEFLGAFACPVLNLHPALPGELPGLHAIERAYAEFESGRRRESGVMVHRVTAELDAGPVIASEIVPIPKGTDLDTFEATMHAAERRVVLEAIRACLPSLPTGPSTGQ